MHNSGTRAARVHARPAFNVFLAFVVAAVSGCAANPYLDSPPQDGNNPENPEKRAARAQGLRDGSMEFALRYLDYTRTAYGVKVAEENNRQTALNAGLLGLGALIIGYAATAKYRHRVAGAALAGGAAYTIGNWNVNAGRTAIYREGQKGLTCVEDLTSPLHEATALRAELDRHEMALTAESRRTTAALNEVIKFQIIASTKAGVDRTVLATADEARAAASAALDRKNETLGNIGGLREVLREAGSNLTAKVNTIRGDVDAALDKTAWDSNNLPRALAGITDYMKFFTPAGVTTKVQPLGVRVDPGAKGPESNAEGARRRPLADDMTQLAGAIGALYAAVANLQGEIAAVQGTLTKLASSDKVKKALDTCGVNIAAAAPVFALEQSSIEIVAGAEAKQSVHISGGSGKYFLVSVEGPFPPKLTAEVVGDAVRLHAQAQTAAGDAYSVRVTDGTTAQVVLTVKFKPKDSPPGVTKVNPLAQPMACAGFENWSQPEVCLLQKLVGAGADGTFGDKTCAAYMAKGKDALGAEDAPSGLLDKTVRTAVRTKSGLPANADAAAIEAKAASLSAKCAAFAKTAAAPAAPVAPVPAPPPASSACVPLAAGTTCILKGAECAFECKLGKGEMNDLRMRLAIFFPDAKISTTSEEFDLPLRALIGRFQEKKGLSVRDGRYNVETANATQGMPRK